MMGKIEDIFCNLFDIRAGEFLRAILMQVHIFLVISSMMIIKPVCSALFLDRFGVARLPHIFILIAAFASIVTIGYSKLLKKQPLFHLIQLTLVLYGISLSVFWWLLSRQIMVGFCLYSIFIVVSIFAVLATSQFWSLANIIFNPREAKRIFGFIGAGAIIGGIFGGYMTKILAPILGSINLIVVCILFVCVCLPITILLKRQSHREENLVAFRQEKEISVLEAHPFQQIRKNRHLFLLSMIIGISVLVAKLVEYQFSAIAITSIPDKDELAAFFGVWISNLNFLSLIIQLFITRRVVGVFGVGVSLFFLPVGIFIGLVTVLVHPALWSAVLLKIFDGSMKNSINKSGIELLTLPIPKNIKATVKAFIDVFVDSIATGIGGLLLIVAISWLHFSLTVVGLLTVLFVMIWIFLVNRIRYEYINSFRVKLGESLPDKNERRIDLKNKSIFDTIVNTLESGNTDQILKTLSMIKDVRNKRLVPSFKKLIQHASSDIRIEVLKIIYYYKKSDFIEYVRPLVSDVDPDIRTEAIHYIFNHTGAGRLDLLSEYLNHSDRGVRESALVCAARESRSNETYKKRFKIKENVEALFLELPEIVSPQQSESLKIVCAKVIGAANISELNPYIYILMNDTSEKVVKAALLSAGESHLKEFVPVLIHFLGQENVHQKAAEAIASFGSEILDLLDERLRNPYVNIHIRRRIPAIISGLGTQKAADILLMHLEQTNHSVRYEIIRGLNTMRRNFPSLYLNEAKIVDRIFKEVKDYVNILATLYSETKDAFKNDCTDKMLNLPKDTICDMRNRLISKLENRLDESLERIFRLLGLKYPPHDIFQIYQGIKGGSQDTRMSAVEFLDNVLETNLKKVIIPIIETALSESTLDEHFDRLGIKTPDEFEGIALLMSIEDKELQILGLELIQSMGNPRYIGMVGEKLASPDANVRAKASEVLKTLGYLLTIQENPSI